MCKLQPKSNASILRRSLYTLSVTSAFVVLMGGGAFAQSAGGGLLSGAGLLGPIATGLDSLAGGNGASAAGANSTVLGAVATDNGVSNSSILGGGASVLQGLRGSNVAIGNGSVASTGALLPYEAYGLRGTQTSIGEVSVGSVLGSRTITNVAPGVANNDAVNVAQLKGATANAVQYTSNNNGRGNTINLQGGNGGNVTIRNVANGILGTDAVNVNQLRSVSSSSVAQANYYTDQRINNLMNLTNAQIGQVRSEAAGGAAIALAATGVRYDDRPGKFSVGGATSYYHDQMGIALGLGHTSEDGRIRMNAAISASPTMDRPDVGAVVGASLSLN